MNIYITDQSDMKIMNIYMMIYRSNCSTYIMQQSNADIFMTAK
jgi:hypothetical protein